MFVGKVSRVEYLYDAPDALDLPAHLTFEVIRNFKGEGDVVIVDADNPAEIGREYLVFASSPVASLHVGACDILATTTLADGPRTEEAARVLQTIEALVTPEEIDRLNWYLVRGEASREDPACDGELDRRPGSG